MANFFAYYPSSSGAANPSVGPNGSPIPADSTLIGFDVAGTLEPVSVANPLPVAVVTSPTPQNVNLTEVGGAALALGQTLSADSIPVVIASDQSAIPVTVASLPLPAGAATSANQTTQIGFETTTATNTTSILANQTNGTQVTSVNNFPALQAVNLTEVGGAAIALGQALSASSVPVVIASDQSPVSTNISEFGGTAVTIGQQLSAASIPVVIASDDTVTISAAALPLPAGAATSANQTNGAQETQIVQGGNAAVVTIAGALTVDGSAVTQPISGTVIANQGTANATPWNENISEWGGTATTLGQKVSASSVPIVIASDQSPIATSTGTPAALTIYQDATTVGTTAVRCTVSGSAPASTRVVLVVTPDNASTANFFIGSSTVTNSGATTGIEIAAGQAFIANNDAGDYWIVSSLAGQTVYIMEQY